MGGRGGSSRGANGLYYGNKALDLEIDGQKIQDLISPYLGKYKYIGIRTQEEPFELGDMQHQSVVWRNGEETNQKIGGISATNIKSEAVSAHSDIKKDYSKMRSYRHDGYYYGDNVAIIVGNEAKRGQDYGEIVIKKPKVVRIVKRGYQFARFWNTPDRYIEKLSQFAAVCAPDFSTYTDMPLAMQIYNHYRKHWLAAYWQLNGITVYPTISWSDENSYEWCFDGEPRGGIVAVSSVGTQKSKESQRLFLRGYEEMVKRLEPTWVIFYGKVPEECDWNVIRIPAYYEKIVKRRKEVRDNGKTE